MRQVRDFFSSVLTLFFVVLKHVVRTRLIYLVILFSVLTQVGGLKLFHDWLGSAIGFLPNIQAHHSVFLSLFLQLFGGTLLCVVYGVWVAPYLHSGLRAQLTFVVPVKRVAFALAHSLGLLTLLLIQYFSLLVTFLAVLGFTDFPWGYFLMGAGIEVLCFLCVMFLFAVLSLSLGPVVALFGGMMILSGLQFAGVLKALSSFLASKGIQIGFVGWIAAYDLLLPAGELVFHLRSVNDPEFAWVEVSLKWLVWFVVLVALYLLTISRTRSTTLLKQ